MHSRSSGRVKKHFTSQKTQYCGLCQSDPVSISINSNDYDFISSNVASFGSTNMNLCFSLQHKATLDNVQQSIVSNKSAGESHTRYCSIHDIYKYVINQLQQGEEDIKRFIGIAHNCKLIVSHSYNLYPNNMHMI